MCTNSKHTSSHREELQFVFNFDVVITAVTIVSLITITIVITITNFNTVIIMNIRIYTIDNNTCSIENNIYQNCNQELQFVINFADCINHHDHTVIIG